MTSPKRPRVAKRAVSRELRKDVRDRERLVNMEPGGSAERPLIVVSAALVEPTALGMRCHQCGGEPLLQDHSVSTEGGDILRVVKTVCRRCRATRTVWLRLQPRLPQ